MRNNTVELKINASSRDAERAIDRVADGLDEVGDEAKTATRKTKKLDKATTGLSGSMSAASSGAKLLTGALAGIGTGMLIHKAVSDFAALDDGLIGVKKTTGLAGEQLEGLESSIHGLASTIPVSQQRLLEIAQAAGQLGVKGRKNIEAFTETLARMETASDVVGEEGAKAMARILNVTGEATSEVDKLGSVVVSLGNNMAASESEIVRMATEIAQATSAFKSSSAQAAAMGAAMRSMGVRAELGGSTVGKAMRTIEAAVSSGGTALRNLEALTGQTGEQLQQTFEQNAPQAFMVFLQGLNQAMDGGKTAEEVLEQFGLRGEEVLKVLPTMAKRNKELARAFNLANAEVDTGTALLEESTIAAGSFGSQLRIARNMATEVASTIGEGLAPTIVDIIGDVRDWVRENEEFIRQDLPTYIDEIATSLATAAGWFHTFGEALGTVAGMSLYGPDDTLMRLEEQAEGLREKIAMITQMPEVGEFWQEKLEGFRKELEITEKTIARIQKQRYPGPPPEPKPKPDEETGGDKPSKDEPGGDKPQTPTFDFEAEKEAALRKRQLEEFNKAYKQATMDSFEFERSQIKAQAKAYKDAGAEAVKVNEWKAAQLKKIAKDEAREQREIKEEFADDYAEATLSQFEFEKREIDALAEKYKEAGVDAVKVAEWRKAEIARISKEETESQKETADKHFDRLQEMSREAAKNMQQGFSNFYFDLMRGEFNSLEDLGRSVFDNLSRMAADHLAQQSAIGLFGDNFMSGGSGNLGGIVGGAMSLFSGGGGAAPPSTGTFQGIPLADGGLINEPIYGVGKSGTKYLMGEAGPEYVVPKKDMQQSQEKQVIINNNITVQAPNGNISKESMTQLQRKIGKSMNRSMRQ